MSITFETKCWEQDWEILLKTDYLKKQIKNCNYPFTIRRLIINNVNDINEVKKYAEKAIKEGIIDEYIVAEEWANEVLNYFSLSREELGKGYYYSIAELTGIYVCSTDYLLHFSSDSRFEYRNNFVADSINLLNEHFEISVCNPMWNYRYHDLRKPNWDESKHFHIGHGFSDQCYLIRLDEYKRDIYHFSHDTGAKYPEYGGELFEKRCNSYMRCNDRFRAVYMKGSYWTENLRGLEDYQKKEKRILHKLITRIRYRYI